ncbi:hypothetical protein D3C80_2058610 [compost metagenome]
MWQIAGEVGFDQAPAQGVIAVRHCADGVDMVGQDDDGIDAPWMPAHGIAEGGAQLVDAIHQ